METKKQRRRKLAPGIFGGLAALLLLTAVLAGCSGPEAGGTSADAPAEAAKPQESQLSQDAPEVLGAADLVIPLGDLSDRASFYPVEVDGTALEVVAVRLADGSVRTAFNTCQVCYDSGRGFYKQEGGVLVCQNCGNRFAMEHVEVQSGGCNPVPIFSENKTETEESVVISGDYLRAAKVIFANWKTEY